jgi:glycosyltransferase involved in cell wall biosynthesis
VTEDTGFKVPAVTPEQVVNDLAEAMHRLAEDPALRTRIGEAGRRRVLEHFDWDKKGEWIKGVYERVFG